MTRLFSTIVVALLCSLSSAQVWNASSAYSLLAECYGSLDADTISERVCVYDTGDTAEFGTGRCILVLKKQQEQWCLWFRSDSAIKSSEEGGMMGDPFAGIEIKARVLMIYHFGGSSWKWSITDKYRFQNKRLQLIGFTCYSGKPCEEWKTIDYNLNTGYIEAKREIESCDENGEDVKTIKSETENWKDKKRVVYFENRYSVECEFESPKKLFDIHL